MKTYITLGFDHVHSINGKTIDKYCVVVINHTEEEDGRAIAFELFDAKFCMEYPEKYWEEKQKKYLNDHSLASKTINIMEEYYPRGYITVREIKS